MLSPTHRPRARLLAGCTAGQSVPCDPNTYNDVGGSTSINAGACKPCPPNSQSPQASTKIEDCISLGATPVDETNTTDSDGLGAGLTAGIAIGATVLVFALVALVIRRQISGREMPQQTATREVQMSSERSSSSASTRELAAEARAAALQKELDELKAAAQQI